ncbi:unnamed protein product, partial [Allacma fusca]
MSKQKQLITVPASINDYYKYVHTVTTNAGRKITVMKCVICNECKRAPTGNFFNFKKHLQVSHDTDSAEASQPSQPTLDSWAGGLKTSKLPLQHPLQLKLDRSIATAIAVDGLPLDLTSGKGFQKIFEIANSKFTIKSRRTMTKRINEIASEVIKKSNISELAILSNGRIHPIIDIWSTRTHESVLGIKVQYLDDDLHMVNKLLAFEEFNEEHSSDNIKKKVQEIFKSLG